MSNCGCECQCESEDIHDNYLEVELKEQLKQYNKKSIFDDEALNQLVDIELDGIDASDYPDFCDAYITSASFGSKRILSDEELDDLNDNHRDFVYQCVINQLF